MKVLPEEVKGKLVSFLDARPECRLSDVGFRRRLKEWANVKRVYTMAESMYDESYFGSKLVYKDGFKSFLARRWDDYAMSVDDLMVHLDMDLNTAVSVQNYNTFVVHSAWLIEYRHRTTGEDISHQVAAIWLSDSLTWREPRFTPVMGAVEAIPVRAAREADKPEHAKQIVTTLVKKRRNLFFLKAFLFNAILTGRVVYAQGLQNIPALFIRHATTWYTLTQAVEKLVVSYFTLMAYVCQIPSYFSKRLPHEVVAFWETTLVLAFLWLTWTLFKASYGWFLCFKREADALAKRVREVHRMVFTTYDLKPSECAGESVYICKRITETGDVHEVVVNGKLHYLNARRNDDVRVDEMALPGSTLYPSTSRPVGAILASTEGTALTVIGCFFRMGDKLVTAKHVANAVAGGVARIYLTGVRETRKQNFVVDLAGVLQIPNGIFSIDENLAPSDYDVFITKLSDATWAKIKVGQISAKRDSHYAMPVSAVGFVNELFMTSAGKTLMDSGMEELWHTATTHNGFSGSPLFSGSGVVGMHVSAAGDKNIAIRIEVIKMLLARTNESSTSDEEKVEHDFKFRGRSHKLKELFHGDLYGFIDKGGRVDIGWTRADVDELLDKYYNGTDKEEYLAAMLLDPNSDLLSNKSYRRLSRYLDENAVVGNDPLLPDSQTDAVEIFPGVLKFPNKERVHCNASHKPNPEVVEYIDTHLEELTKMGYDAEKFTFPVITPELEAHSVVKHLQMYHERCLTVSEPMPDEMNRAVRLTAEMMKHNKFEPDIGWRSLENVKRIINSSAIKDGKSPGHPYQSAGLPVIEQVLKKYTVEGFAEVVLRDWDEPVVEVKTFVKNEAMKKAKIEKGMPRIVAGMPLHKTVKNNAVFGPLAENMVAEWKNSPVKYAFNPQRAGDIAHLANVFKRRRVHESDKPQWDYSYFLYIADGVNRVVKELAVRPDGMSEEDFVEFLADVDSCFREVFHDAVYRCTNGNVFRAIMDGIMKSGWFFTIGGNSMGQILLHVLALIRCGCSDEEILSPSFAIVAGGDDVLQTFPDDFDVQSYWDNLQTLGFKVEERKVHDSFDQCEFFSNKFELVDGQWTYKPVRFTKHIAHLSVVKTADLAGALASHMLNHVWDTKKFLFFDNMFKHFRAKFPCQFPLAYYKTRNQLRYKVLGLEASC